MDKKAITAAITSILGFATGPISLQTAAMSRPPIDQSALVVILLGTALGLPFVLGIQAARKDSRPFAFFWYLFAVGAIYLLSTGLSAAITSMIAGAVSPHSFLFVVMGIGMSLGLLACRKLFASKFAAST